MIMFVTSIRGASYDVRTDMVGVAVISCADCGCVVTRIAQNDRALLFRSIGWFVNCRCPARHVVDRPRELGMRRG